MEKAVIYCRANSGSALSIVNQEKSCRKFAETHNFVVDGVYADRGEVGNTIELKELQRLLGYVIVVRTKPSAIIVARLDRLTRNLSDYTQLYNCLNKLGIKILSPDTEEQYTDDAVGNLQRHIKMAFTEYEQNVRSERIKQGLKRKRNDPKN